MTSLEFKYIYGPVPSRRLGRSLGIDLVPYKTCNYDCIYCQLGKTTVKTTERKPYVRTADVLFELERKLAAGSRPDVISMAGSGEPTLNSEIGTMIRRIKGVTDIPVVVLTNGSLLWMDEVQQELMDADLVMPSLDVGDAGMFEYVNRPESSISFERMVDGLITFTRLYPRDVWLEVLLLAGVTAIPVEVAKIAEVTGRIQPARIQLNTAVRPTVEEFAFSVPADQLHELGALFPGTVEVISAFSARNPEMPANTDSLFSEVISLLRRRPCTMADIAEGLGVHLMEAIKLVDRLMKEGNIKSITKNRAVYFVPQAGSGAGCSVKTGGVAP